MRNRNVKIVVTKPIDVPNPIIDKTNYDSGVHPIFKTKYVRNIKLGSNYTIQFQEFLFRNGSQFYEM